MTTGEPSLNSFETAQFETPPDAIVKKEQELSALLDRVLAAPLRPVLESLDELSNNTERSRQKLASVGDDLSSIGEDADKVHKATKKVLRILEGLEEDQRQRFKELIQAAVSSQAAAAERDGALLETVCAIREEALQAAAMATRRARIALFLLAILLAAAVGHIAIDVIERTPFGHSASMR